MNIVHETARSGADQFAAVDQAEAEWKAETFRLSDHQDGCRVCTPSGPCGVYQALRRTELAAWSRFYEARRDSGML